VSQWDVFANPAVASRDRIPYLVVLQSDLLDGVPTRLVAPLSRSSVPTQDLPRRLAPSFVVAGESLVLKPHEAGIVPARLLKQPVASLRDQSHRLIDALDAVVSGI
jgi:toxin CcdB